MIPVKESPNWFRNGKAVVNTDASSYATYMEKRGVASSKQQEIDNVKSSINNLNERLSQMESSIDKIINLLQK